MDWYRKMMDWIFSEPVYAPPKVYSVRVRGNVPGEDKEWLSRWIPATDKNVDNYTFLAGEWNRLYGAGTHTLEFEYTNEV